MSYRTPLTPLTLVDPGADSDEDLAAPTAALEARLEALRERRRDIGAKVDERRAVELALDEAALLVQLERGDEARHLARDAFDRAMDASSYDQAVRACELVFLADREDALAALGQGVWLTVTFPMDPELTLAMLRHVVDETPDDADGAAVAAAAGAYVVDLRADDGKHADLSFFAMQMLGEVARRHAGVDDQAAFDAWVERLELTEPEKFLVRLRNVVDVLVQDDWWFDREGLARELPIQ